MKYVAVLILGCVLVLGGLAVLEISHAEAQTSAPLFRVGQKYLVVWDCWPESVVQAMGLPNPCYVEVLHIQGVRSDGWVVVQDQQGADWTINPNRAIAIMAAKPQQLAER